MTSIEAPFNRTDATFSGHLFHRLHLGDVELQHVLDAVLQSDDGTGAGGARALELQLHDAVVETPVEHVAAVLLHRGPERGGKNLLLSTTGGTDAAQEEEPESVRAPDPCVEQLLNDGDDLVVIV